jgi:hypothetical protein
MVVKTFGFGCTSAVKTTPPKRRDALEVEAVRGGPAREKPLFECSSLRAHVEAMLERVIQFGNEGILAERIHRLVGDEELGDEVRPAD